MGLDKATATNRGFWKVAAALVAAAMIACAAAFVVTPSKAYAATGDSVAVEDMVVDKEYTVTANLYVKAKFNSILSMDAYLTNTTTPSLLKKPTTPVSKNATIVKNSNGSYTVTVSNLNNTFGLLSIGPNTDDGSGATVTSTETVTWTCQGGYTSRIDKVVFSVTSSEGSYEFPAKEYANYLVYEDKEWPVTLQLEFSSIIEK